MSNLDYLNLSTDLRRIAYWLEDNDESLADKFIEINKIKFGNDKSEIGKKTVVEWISGIEAHKERGWKSAEDALTLSVLLKNRFA